MSRDGNRGIYSRFGGGRSKSGCLTCRKRHVKCDEKRPICQKCIDGNRDCGYAPPAGKDLRQQELRMIVYGIQQPSQDLNHWSGLTRDEIRSLHHFTGRAAHQIAGPFASGFWDLTLMRMAQQHRGVAHAIIALSSLHEQVELQDLTLSFPSTFSLKQYSKAIQDLVQMNPASSPTHGDVALVSSILFGAYEAFQGHYLSSMTHIKSGLRITKEMREGKLTSFLPKNIEPTLVRLDNQLIELSDVLSGFVAETSPSPELVPIPPKFLSIEEAHNSLDIFYNHNLHMLWYMGPQSGISEEVLAQIPAMFQELHRYYSKWQEAFEDSKFSKSTPGVALIKVYMQYISLLHTADFSAGEKAWDTKTSEFSQIADAIEEIIDDPTSHLKTQISGKPAGKPTFTMSLGVIVPLFIIGRACRDPRVRRRAVKLLKKHNRQEGIWNTQLVAEILEHLISMEEDTVQGPVTRAEDIPLWPRIAGLHLVVLPSRKIKVSFHRNYTSTGQFVPKQFVSCREYEWGGNLFGEGLKSASLYT